MEDNQTIEEILNQINDPSVKMIAEHALLSARKALDMAEFSRVKHVVDEIDKIMPRALKARVKNETS